MAYDRKRSESKPAKNARIKVFGFAFFKKRSSLAAAKVLAVWRQPRSWQFGGSQGLGSLATAKVFREGLAFFGGIY